MAFTIPAAIVQALRHPVPVAADFSPMHFTPAETNAWFASHFLRFASADFPKHHFTQQAILASPPTAFRAPDRPAAPPALDFGSLPVTLATQLARAAEELRALYEAGEIEWTDLNPARVWEFAFA